MSDDFRGAVKYGIQQMYFKYVFKILVFQILYNIASKRDSRFFCGRPSLNSFNYLLNAIESIKRYKQLLHTLIDQNWQQHHTVSLQQHGFLVITSFYLHSACTVVHFDLHFFVICGELLCRENEIKSMLFVCVLPEILCRRKSCVLLLKYVAILVICLWCKFVDIL